MDRSLFIAQQGMDKENKVTSLEMIGWSEPDDTNYPKKAVKWLKNITFNGSVYPEHLM